MKNNNFINLAIICCLLLTPAFKCGRSNDDSGGYPTPKSTPITSRSNEKDSRLKGNYVYTNGYSSFKRFVFDTDGSFARGAAVSGSMPDFSAATEDAGTYQIKGGTLTLNCNDGTTETHQISLQSSEVSPLYSTLNRNLIKC